MKRRPWPANLAGQIALLVAIALFVAQAINFAMLLHERRAVRFAQVTMPTVTRLVDGAERLRSGRQLRAARDGREWQRGVRLLPASPLGDEHDAAAEVESELRRGFAEAGLRIGRVMTRVRPFDPVRDRDNDPRRIERLRRLGASLTVAAELPGRGWLVSDTPWPLTERGVFFQLGWQILVFYAVVLLPVLWIGLRIARPLRKLAIAARGFRPGAPAPTLEEEGPADVRAVIAAFNGMGARVTAMLDEKDRMLGAIGHDLRTPLAALRVRIESVEDDTDRQRMAETVDEMNRTLEDILSLARSGRPSEPITDVDLAALVDAVAEDFRDLGADISLADAPRTPVRLRPTLMRRAIRNLIENAVKYAGSAEVQLVERARHYAIEVADRGPGIPPDRLAAVFDPFTRLETSRNRDTGGIGLGLALARAIVHDAGGEITLTNRDGGGLRATVLLPR